MRKNSGHFVKKTLVIHLNANSGRNEKLRKKLARFLKFGIQNCWKKISAFFVDADQKSP